MMMMMMMMMMMTMSMGEGAWVRGLVATPSVMKG
jgi:hypothetical protein